MPYSAAYREAHKEELAAKKKARNQKYYEMHVDKAKVYNKAYQEANKEALKAKAKEYYKAHKFEISEYQRA